jgi:hypothetical protein
MIYRIFIITFLAIFSIQGMAGEKRYRVEIIVLTHMRHEAVPADAESLRDFSGSLDFLAAKSDENENEKGEDEDRGDSQDDVVGVKTGTELLPDEDQPEDPWADVIAVEEMSEVMREAWRRLRLSAPFRPEQYLSWEQSANEPFPSLRIHDPQVLLIENSCTVLDETLATEAGEDAAKEHEDTPFVFTDQGNILPGDALKDAAEEAELPDPTLFHRIDGTVMLRRSRFLHLDIDLELRQATFDEQPLPLTPILGGGPETGEPDESELPAATSFLIHLLEQSRQVKSQRMEYFDSPVLGVLAWITPFEAEDEAESIPD